MIATAAQHTATLATSPARAVTPYTYNVPVSPPGPMVPATYTVPAGTAAAGISPTNEYVPFAANIGANVEDQLAYAADPVVQWGFPPGAILPSPTANRLWRQSSFIAAGVAQAIAEILRVDMLDDGNLPLFVTRFRQAIASMGSIGGGGMPEPPPDGRVYGRHWAAARAGQDPHSVSLHAMTESAEWIPVLPLWGGVLEGPLVLAGRSAEPNSPVTRAELDEVREIAQAALPRDGSKPMEGPLILWRMPEEDMEAVPRIYADTLAGSGTRPPIIDGDAPADNNFYVRQLGEWTNTLDCGDYTVFWWPFIQAAAEFAGVEEAPLDGGCYFRRNAQWTNVADGGDYTITGLSITAQSNALGIPEAPEDGSSFVRRNNGWTNVIDPGTYI